MAAAVAARRCGRQPRPMVEPDSARPAGDGRRSRSPAEVALDLRFEAGELYLVRTRVATCAADLGATTDVIERLLIVASELTTNAIRHGGGEGRLRLWADDDHLHCEVIDVGVGVPDPMAGMIRPPPSAPGGRGLWISRQLGDAFAIDRGATGTVIRVTMALDGDENSRDARSSN